MLQIVVSVLQVAKSYQALPDRMTRRSIALVLTQLLQQHPRVLGFTYKLPLYLILSCRVGPQFSIAVTSRSGPPYLSCSVL
jgi:hypothetical protein